MARKKDAEVLGRCDCGTCGERMAVLQNVRGALYTVCPECKCDQRNGAKHQTNIWFGTEWINGEPEKKPYNLLERPVPEPAHEPLPEPCEPTKSKEKQIVSEKGSWPWFLLPVGIVTAILIGK